MFLFLTNGNISTASRPSSVLRLTDTDFAVLRELRNGRNTAANIAAEIDRARNYINARLVELADHDLVRDVSVSDRGGLYELTPRGLVAEEHSDRYDNVDDFAEFVDERVRTGDVVIEYRTEYTPDSDSNE